MGRELLTTSSLVSALAQLGDLVPVAGYDISLGADPGTADSMDEGGVDEFLDVVIVDTAGGQELHGAEGSSQVLQSLQTAVNVGGEELDHLQAVLHSSHDFSGSDAAGSNGNAVLNTPTDDFIAEAGGNDELSTHFNGQLALLQIYDGAGAYQNIGAVVGNSPDSFGSACSTEGDLHSVDAAGGHSLCGGDSILNLVQDNNGNDDGISQSF